MGIESNMSRCGKRGLEFIGTGLDLDLDLGVGFGEIGWLGKLKGLQVEYGLCLGWI